jgi:MFS family permease
MLGLPPEDAAAEAPDASAGAGGTAPGASRDAARLVLARGLRGFADGLLAVLLPAYLTGLGFTPFQVGALLTATLLGSAGLTLAVGLAAHRAPARGVLLAACGLMLGTALGLELFTGFAALLAVALLGTLNASASDVSVFLPVEQALLAESGAASRRTALFARYSVAGGVGGALGSLASGAPALLAQALGLGPSAGPRLAFAGYGLLALGLAALYRPLAVGRRPAAAPPGAPRAALATSRPLVLRLTALFSLDSFGGGFAVQAVLALWLFERFALPVEVAGGVFFAANALAAASQLVSPWLAARIGLVPTMVFTHLPANAFLIAAAFAPGAPLAVTFLLLRSALSQMDVPARQAYVMGVVPPAERAAAASVTNVPRSLAAGVSPLLAGALLSATSFGWPLVVGGALKIAYDLALLALFRGREPDERDGEPGPVGVR